MATQVTQIVNALEGEVAAELSGFSKLSYVYDVEKNNFRGNANRYGVVPLGIVSSSGVTRASTTDQVFQVVYTDEYRNAPATDLVLQESVKNLFDKAEDVLKRVYQQKVGLPSIVLIVSLDSVDDPEIIEEHKIVVLRQNLLVKYRRLID